MNNLLQLDRAVFAWINAGWSNPVPSGHAANAFMVAALLSEWLRRKRYCLYGMAALVALSRIYLGVHYPGDVLVGACLGFSITWLMLFFYPLKSIMARGNLPGPHN
jgi:membrane-associated phospholipid phosphatase